uniref:Uncharacterized protein n=1 Tax=Rhizophora mucronata TaxID=61149 RepID=A0A2P2QNJ6_RHIMU
MHSPYKFSQDLPLFSFWPIINMLLSCPLCQLRIIY